MVECILNCTVNMWWVQYIFCIIRWNMDTVNASKSNPETHFSEFCTMQLMREVVRSCMWSPTDKTNRRYWKEFKYVLTTSTSVSISKLKATSS